MNAQMIRTAILILLVFCASNMMAQEEVYSADHYYNMGVQEYEAEAFGEAIYLFEKALVLEPRSTDALINLELAKERIDADIVELDQFFLASWWQSVHSVMMPGTWKILTLLLLALIASLLFIFLFKKERLSTGLFSGAISVLMLLLLISVFAGRSRSNFIHHNSFAIATNDAKTLNEGPDEVSSEIKDIVGGVKLEVLDEDGVWYKVSTMDKEQGWIKKNLVRFLRFEER